MPGRCIATNARSSSDSFDIIALIARHPPRATTTRALNCVSSEHVCLCVRRLLLTHVFRCFDQNFPFMHEHPRSGFAVQSVIDSAIGPMPIKGELVTVWEEDVMDELPEQTETQGEDTPQEATPAKTHDTPAHPIEASQVFDGQRAIQTAEEGYEALKRWQRRKVCAFCNDDDDTSDELGAFIGPFLIATFNKNGVECKRQFWAHDACARYSPEVFCTPEGKWYNVTLALRRGRGNVRPWVWACVYHLGLTLLFLRDVLPVKKRALPLVALIRAVPRASIYPVHRSRSATFRMVSSFGVLRMRRITIRKVDQ